MAYTVFDLNEEISNRRWRSCNPFRVLSKFGSLHKKAKKSGNAALFCCIVWGFLSPYGNGIGRFWSMPHTLRAVKKIGRLAFAPKLPPTGWESAKAEKAPQW